MEELKKFIGLLKANMLILIVVPLATIIITYFLVRNQPNSYISQAQIATGIVDEIQQSQQQSLFNQSLPQGEQIKQKFSNLIAMMRMKNTLDQVSYALILHDLLAPTPFKKPSSLLKTLNKAARSHAIKVFTEKYNMVQSLNLNSSDQRGLFEVIKSMKYDSKSIDEKLIVNRSGDSDFLIIEFESEDPELSAFVVNTLSNQFVKNYSAFVKVNKVKANNLLAELLAQKSDTLTKRMSALRTYKIANRVLNLDEQSKQLYTRIIQYEDKKQEAIQNTSSFAGAVNEIDKKFDPNERKYLEAIVSKVNQQIISTKDELNQLYDRYYKSDFEDRYKNSIDSLQLILTERISKASDQYITNPLASKQSLIQQKMDLEIKLDLSRFSIHSLETELDKLNSSFDKLVPREADVQTMEMEIDIATKEYTDILNKYNQSSLEANFSVNIRVVQLAMPGIAQPSKKVLLVILSGIISFLICMVVFFGIYFFDKRVYSSKELANSTGYPVLASFNELSRSFNLKNVWENDDQNKSFQTFKNELRSLRYEIESEIKDKIILVSSSGKSEGKTFLSLSLAYAYKMSDHKVLLIDANSSISPSTSGSSDLVNLDDFLKGDYVFDKNTLTAGEVVRMSTFGDDRSLLELSGYSNIKDRLSAAKEVFDIIIIEVGAVDNINQSKEWMLFCDGIIAVFKYGSTLNEEKITYINYLKNTGLFRGWIMNKVPLKA